LISWGDVRRRPDSGIPNRRKTNIRGAPAPAHQ
jgi:hypothetical protein